MEIRKKKKLLGFFFHDFCSFINLSGKPNTYMISIQYIDMYEATGFGKFKSKRREKSFNFMNPEDIFIFWEKKLMEKG